MRDTAEMNTQKVALAMICGDSWTEENVKRLLASVEPHVHGIFVSYNGKGKFPKWHKWTKLPIVWGKVPWTEKFQEARNHSFSLVPMQDFDWVMWLDTDDELIAPDGLEGTLIKADEYSSGIFVKYEYGIIDGAVVVEQYRERVLRTNVAWTWMFDIHEVCRGPINSQFSQTEAFVIRHHRVPGMDEATRKRNRKIVARARREQPEEPRYMFYMANELLGEALEGMDESDPMRKGVIEASISEYRKFLSIAPYSDDVYHAQERVAELFYAKRDYNAAIDEAFQCVKLMPSWPDAYVLIAKCLMEIGDFPRMFEFANMACNTVKPSTVASLEPMLSSFTPLFLRGIANEHMGRLEAAIADYQAALDIHTPPEGKLDEKIEELMEKLAEDPEDAPKDLRFMLRGTFPGKSICFFTNPCPDPWGPVSSKIRGVGGAETCVMELASRFAADGWRTVVFGTPAPEDRGIAGGYEVWGADEWRHNEPFTVFVGSRAPNAFEAEINAKLKLLWLHDVNMSDMLVPAKVKPDAYIALTQWHAQHVSKLYGIDRDRFLILPNGVTTSRFPELKEREGPPKLVYASSPDRGVDVLLTMWPMIRSRWSDAELHVYYGWDMIDSIIALSGGTHPIAFFKASVIAQIEALGGEEGGIFWHGRTGQENLAVALQDMDVWAYPTYFMETFCITALEMQLAGAVPVTSNLAALRETVKDTRLLVDGWPNNVTYQRAWLNLLARVLDDDLASEVRPGLRELALPYDWDNAYAMWSTMIGGMLGTETRDMSLGLVRAGA